MKKIAIYLMIAATGANFGCGARRRSDGNTNIAETPKIAACDKRQPAEASKSDLLDAADDFAKTENFGRAEAVCDEFERRFPEHFARFECRGNILLKQRRFARALVYFDRLVEAKPTYSYGLLQRSFVHEQFGNLDRAFADADAAFKLIEPEAEQDDTRSFAAKILVQRGYVQYLKGANDLALKDYDRAIELHPKGHLAYTARSYLCHKLGQTALADADERRGKELKQTNKEG